MASRSCQRSSEDYVAIFSAIFRDLPRSAALVGLAGWLLTLFGAFSASVQCVIDQIVVLTNVEGMAGEDAGAVDAELSEKRRLRGRRAQRTVGVSRKEALVF